MTTDPTSTQPLRAQDHIALAERYATFTEYATFTSSIPQTAATTLDVARFHAFTGEVTFLIDPTVRLYLDGGSVYFAERKGDPAVADSLIAAGVLDSVQLKHGVVRVGELDHLGRLFDRAPSVDRDAAMVFVEGLTERLLHELANSVISAVNASAYRHHPSGIHRWFVAPVETIESHRPETSVTINWSTPDLAHEASSDPDQATFDAPVDIDIQAELARFDADQADWAATIGGSDPDASEAISSPLGEFYIVWPDGTRERPIEVEVPKLVAADPDEQPPASGLLPPPVGPAFDPLHVDRLPEPTAPVPDDVAMAVQRALRAIEGAPAPRSIVSDHPPHATPVVMPETPMSELPAPTGSEPTPELLGDSSHPGARDAGGSASALLGFAPPTPDMRAEALFERDDAAESADIVIEPIIAVDDDESIAGLPAPAAPEPAQEAADRRGALRRLIDSLRPKD